MQIKDKYSFLPKWLQSKEDIEKTEESKKENSSETVESSEGIKKHPANHDGWIAYKSHYDKFYDYPRYSHKYYYYDSMDMDNAYKKYKDSKDENSDKEKEESSSSYEQWKKKLVESYTKYKDLTEWEKAIHDRRKYNSPEQIEKEILYRKTRSEEYNKNLDEIHKKVVKYTINENDRTKIDVEELKDKRRYYSNKLWNDIDNYYDYDRYSQEKDLTRTPKDDNKEESNSKDVNISDKDLKNKIIKLENMLDKKTIESNSLLARLQEKDYRIKKYSTEVQKFSEKQKQLQIENDKLKKLISLFESDPDEYKKRKSVDPFDEENWE